MFYIYLPLLCRSIIFHHSLFFCGNCSVKSLLLSGFHTTSVSVERSGWRIPQHKPQDVGVRAWWAAEYCKSLQLFLTSHREMTPPLPICDSANRTVTTACISKRLRLKTFRKRAAERRPLLLSPSVCTQEEGTSAELLRGSQIIFRLEPTVEKGKGCVCVWEKSWREREQEAHGESGEDKDTNMNDGIQKQHITVR